MTHSLISKCRKGTGGLFFVIGFRVSRDDRLADLSVNFFLKISKINKLETGVTYMDS